MLPATVACSTLVVVNPGVWPLSTASEFQPMSATTNCAPCCSRSVEPVDGCALLSAALVVVSNGDVEAPDTSSTVTAMAEGAFADTVMEPELGTLEALGAYHVSVSD